jgi:hypothetical protein
MKETTRMNETVEMDEPIETVKEVTVKHYTFRKLSSKDIFLMTKILGKIGIRQFKGCFEGENLDALVATFKAKKTDEALISIGVAVGFEGIDIIIGNLYKCEKDIYELLSAVSGVSTEEIEEDALLFTEMLIDFFKKPEFPDFIKVVSKLF